MIITANDLSKIRTRHQNQKVVFCSGGFDLTHAGHLLFFEDSKKHGDVLVVMTGQDEELLQNKGQDRPILNQHIRLKMIDSFKPVDYAMLSTHLPKKHPLDPIDTIFESLKPDVYVINQDASDIPYRQAMSKRHNVNLVILPRWCPPEFENISTSKIIERIRQT